MAAVQLTLSKTRIGKSMRATADNRALAAVCGLDTTRITTQTWLISGFLAGVAGAILAIHTRTFNPELGANYVFLIFPAVIVGGIGRPIGAVIGSLIIGAIGAVGSLYIPSAFSTLLIFATLVAIVLLRPQGLVGESRRVSLQSG
jgi:branched-subunit amino acid ABC-type transport system permease component